MAIQSIAIFCRVVDNFGDIGVCWRLARQFRQEYGLVVQLWVDDLVSFQRLCAQVQITTTRQSVAEVDVIHWSAAGLRLLVDGALGACDAVIEGFACQLPDEYFALMRAQASAPVWLNLEYLSAELWVEECHGLPSPHPQTGMRKYFFFPGFSARTGGLLAESNLPTQRDAFQREAHARFWQLLGVQLQTQEIIVGIFCYPTAPLVELFSIWQAGPQPVLCLIAEGVASAQIAEYFQQPLVSGMCVQRGSLCVQVLPFVEQTAYDQFLWAADLNFVRGEDSFVRAQWAARPMIWQIYQQEENIHLEKLDAFLTRYGEQLAPECNSAVRNLTLAWNTALPLTDKIWLDYLNQLPTLRSHSQRWADEMQKNGHLAANLLKFINEHQASG